MKNKIIEKHIGGIMPPIYSLLIILLLSTTRDNTVRDYTVTKQDCTEEYHDIIPRSLTLPVRQHDITWLYRYKSGHHATLPLSNTSPPVLGGTSDHITITQPDLINTIPMCSNNLRDLTIPLPLDIPRNVFLPKQHRTDLTFTIPKQDMTLRYVTITIRDLRSGNLIPI